MTVRYGVAITDGTSTSPTQILTFVINGTNDGPTVSATAATPITEADDASAQDLNQAGTVSFDDIDFNDVVDISASYNGDIVYSGGALPAGLAALLTTGTFTASATNAAAPGTTPWSYLANNVNLDFLDPGESISFSFTVTATDSQGATATDTVTITINGTDDQVTITGIGAEGGDETVDEDDLLASRGPGESRALTRRRNSTTQDGSFTFSAPDGVDIISVGIGGVLIVDNGVVTANINVPINTTYGTVTITSVNLATGVVNYSYELGDNTFDHGPAQDDGEDFGIRKHPRGRYRHQHVHGQQRDHHQHHRRRSAGEH